MGPRLDRNTKAEQHFTSALSSSSSSPCQHIVRSVQRSSDLWLAPNLYRRVNATPRAKWAGGRHKEIKRGRVKCGRRGNASQRGYPSRHQAALAFPVSSKFAAVSGLWDQKEGQRPPFISPHFRLSLVMPQKIHAALSLEWLRFGVIKKSRAAILTPLGLWYNLEGGKRKDAFSKYWLKAKQWDRDTMLNFSIELHIYNRT